MNKPTIPLDEFRKLIADAIAANVSAQNVPSVCLAAGIQEAVQEVDASNAFRSKRGYVTRHLLGRSKEDLVQIAARIVKEFNAPDLQDQLSEMTSQADVRVSAITRERGSKSI